MIKSLSPKSGRPRNKVRDPDGNPVAFLGSYERKNRKGNSSKTVYYSYWLDENALGKDGKPKKKNTTTRSPTLPFSKWDAIFKDPMTTAAAIDRLVHRSVILELNISSYRVKHAKATKKKAAG